MAHQQRNSTSEQISQQWAGRMHRLLKDDIIMRPPPTVQEVLNAMGAVRREGQQVTKQNVRKAILFSRNLNCRTGDRLFLNKFLISGLGACIDFWRTRPE